ncbi:Hsp20 family protein [Kitasatospora sp. NPDC056181]|uniref:Hsp20 family protein n=1 Tax=Kitasatospora sp. NPDC056181 TaxID=3345737 RepID=UPI0035E05B2F
MVEQPARGLGGAVPRAGAWRDGAGRGRRRPVLLDDAQRLVRLPAGVREEDVTAGYDKGVLTVRAPIGETRRTTRKIDISRGG